MYNSWTVTNPSEATCRELKFSAITFFMSLTFLVVEAYLFVFFVIKDCPYRGVVSYAAMAWFLYICTREYNKTRLYFFMKWLNRHEYYLGV